MKTDPKEIGARIKESLVKKKMTQRALAELLKTTDTTVSNYIKGSSGIPAEVYVFISELCGVSIDWLMTGKESLNYVSESQLEYALSAREEKALHKLLEDFPEARETMEAMIALPPRKRKIYLGKMLEDLEKLEEDGKN
jgi:transcriptional regulator with XRE-family HTH domain